MYEIHADKVNLTNLLNINFLNFENNCVDSKPNE